MSSSAIVIISHCCACSCAGQLYTVVGDRTLADQQLEVLRRAGEVLLFKLGSVGDEDTAVMLTAGTK